MGAISYAGGVSECGGRSCVRAAGVSEFRTFIFAYRNQAEFFEKLTEITFPQTSYVQVDLALW